MNFPTKNRLSPPIWTLTPLSKSAKNGIEVVHPGYGFLSENVHFAQSLKDAGITFIGPTPQNLATFGDKTAAREVSIRMNVPVVP